MRPSSDLSAPDQRRARVHSAVRELMSEQGFRVSMDAVAARAGLASIDALYLKKRGNKAFDPHWYELLGHRSIRQLAKALKEGPAYDLWYGGGSQVVHAQSPTQHWSVLGDVAALKAIRHLEDAHSVKDGVAQVALHAYRLVVRKYLPDDFPEEVAYTALFLASDEARFINATDITIDGGRSQVYHD